MGIHIPTLAIKIRFTNNPLVRVARIFAKVLVEYC